VSTSTTSTIGFTHYLAEIRRIPNLNKEEEWTLAARAQQGDRAATNRLITSHLPLVVGVAKRYHQIYGHPLEELVGEGNIALVSCIKNFDPSRSSFAAYAKLEIRTKLRMYVLGNHSMVVVTPSTHQKRAFFGLPSARAKVAGNQINSLSDQQVGQIAKLLNVPASMVITMDTRLRGDLSLNTPRSDEHSGEWQDTLPAEDNPELRAIENIDTAKLQALLAGILNTLPQRTREIFMARQQDPPVPYSELCDTYGLPPAYLIHITTRTMQRVKKRVAAELAT